MHGGESRGTFSFKPNVIPMIDIVLVLLIIFMLMNLGERKVLELQLPQEEVSTKPSENSSPAWTTGRRSLALAGRRTWYFRCGSAGTVRRSARRSVPRCRRSIRRSRLAS